jgi:hypothetical protein
MQKSIGLATALLLGVLVAFAPNVGIAKGFKGAKKSSVHKPAIAAKKPGNVKRNTAGKPSGADKNTGDDEVTRLDGIQRRLIDDMQRLGGGITPEESIGHVNENIGHLRGSIERVERAEKKSGMTSKEIEAQRKQFENQSVSKNNPTDRALGEIVKRTLSESAGKLFGVLSVAENIAEYGVRYKIKRDNIAAMEDLLKQEHANSEELSRLDGKLHRDLSDSYDRLNALKKMQVLYKKVTLKLAKARAPVSLRHALLDRDKGTAGDEEVIRKEKKYGKKHIRIERVDGQHPSRLRRGIHRSTSNLRSSRRAGLTRAANARPFGWLPALFRELFRNPPPATVEAAQLRHAAELYSEAQAAFSQGPSESGDAEIEFSTARSFLKRLADPKTTHSRRVRKLAGNYLSLLPDHFVPGFAFMRDDGTWAADPGPNVRLAILKNRYIFRGGGGAGDGGGGAD